MDRRLVVTIVFEILVISHVTSVANRPRSCQDIYELDPDATSGEYSVYTRSGKTISVFCDFYSGSGYTFLHQSSIASILNTDLSLLYNKRDHAIIRILYDNKEQHDVSVEQLPQYKQRYPLSFQLNAATGYQGPVNRHLGPYLYLGFLPVEVASLKSTLRNNAPVQGYVAGGKEMTFVNCDKNANSYIAFLVNPHIRRPKLTGSSNAFMSGWITAAQLVPSSRYMTRGFFTEFEMHMGGCGGLMFSSSLRNRRVVGAVLGLPFATL